MGGGDLLNLLIERDVFPEDFTRFYVAEVRGTGLRATSPSSPSGSCFRRWFLLSNLATDMASYTVTSSRMCVLLNRSFAQAYLSRVRIFYSILTVISASATSGSRE